MSRVGLVLRSLLVASPFFLLAPSPVQALVFQVSPAGQSFEAREPGPDGGRLFGKVLTRSGEEYEGYIRWDRNEAAWADLLHGSKWLPDRNYEDAIALGIEAPEAARESVEFFGYRIEWGEEETWSAEALCAVRFGHLRSIEVLDDERAILVLKSGMELEMHASSTDLGSGVREIQVEDPEQGLVSLKWGDLELVDFSSSAEVPPSKLGVRLYGTLTTRSGLRFTGFISWDNDEVFDSDILDGEERGEDRDIPFREVAAIERDGSDAARVVLKGGETIRLQDSNDVNDENRGITVADPALGQVTVMWDEFESLMFTMAPSEDLYAAFDGGRSLYGTVRTVEGELVTGYIRWDNDEEFTWEILDGDHQGVEFDIEFSNIARVERTSDSHAEVILRDGRSFELTGSNDVNNGNKGVFVTTEEDEILVVEWVDLEGVSFRDWRSDQDRNPSR